MKRYLIYQPTKIGSYLRDDTYFVYIKIRDMLTNDASDPNNVAITIKNPCGSELVSSATMTNEDVGIYSYSYEINATADYGKYIVDVKTTDYAMKEEYAFYVLPFDISREVRQLSGTGEIKSIDDDALNQLIYDSYKEVLARVYAHHTDEQPASCNISACNICVIDGTNTTFYTRTKYLADGNGDGTVSGYGEKSCGTDVDAYYLDCNYNCHQCLVTVEDTRCGKLTITQLDGTAIPATSQGLYISYYTHTPRYTESLFQQAVSYLSAHKVLLRFGELERATTADLNSAQNIKYVDPERMYKEYKRIMRRISKSPIVGVPGDLNE